MFLGIVAELGKGFDQPRSEDESVAFQKCLTEFLELSESEDILDIIPNGHLSALKAWFESFFQDGDGAKLVSTTSSSIKEIAESRLSPLRSIVDTVLGAEGWRLHSVWDPEPKPEYLSKLKELKIAPEMASGILKFANECNDARLKSQVSFVLCLHSVVHSVVACADVLRGCTTWDSRRITESIAEKVKKLRSDFLSFTRVADSGDAFKRRGQKVFAMHSDFFEGSCDGFVLAKEVEREVQGAS